MTIFSNTYTNRSNANRAAKVQMSKAPEGSTLEVWESAAGWNVRIAAPEAPAALDFNDDIQHELDSAHMGDEAPVALEELGLYGAGTEAEPKCPHCGIDHVDNGYAGSVLNDEQRKNGAELYMHEFECMACGGGWGKPVVGFAAQFEAHKAAGNSKCRSLRLTAAEWGNSRKEFIAAAVEYGIKPATASANWAAMMRGEF